MSTRERQKHDPTRAYTRRRIYVESRVSYIPRKNTILNRSFHRLPPSVTTKPNFNERPFSIESTFVEKMREREREMYFRGREKKDKLAKGLERRMKSWGSIFLSAIENPESVPLVGPPTASHKYGASYGQLRAINRDFISKLAAPCHAAIA